MLNPYRRSDVPILEQRDRVLQARVDAGIADPITDYDRALAAKVRVLCDKKRGVASDPWIVELADSV